MERRHTRPSRQLRDRCSRRIVGSHTPAYGSEGACPGGKAPGAFRPAARSAPHGVCSRSVSCPYCGIPVFRRRRKGDSQRSEGGSGQSSRYSDEPICGEERRRTRCCLRSGAEQRIYTNLNISTSQHFNITTPQPLNPSTSQHLNITTPQPLNISTSQPLNLSPPQPLNISACIHARRQSQQPPHSSVAALDTIHQRHDRHGRIVSHQFYRYIRRSGRS